MSKMSFRVSGSRVGDDSSRPSAAKLEPVMPSRTKQLGLHVEPVRPRAPFVPRPAVTVPLTPDDYATAEDYK